ncbi:MAG: hypothetical protein NTV80_25685, partial [Verrucomicrobia bacterium]|nr:hypothetical protein [Verrucomicrobiota bacterium]
MPEPDVRLARVDAEIEQAEVIEARIVPSNLSGTMVKQRVIRWHGKYPLLRIEEDVPRDPAQRGERRLMVADHLMVKLRAGFTEDQMRGWVLGMGFNVRDNLPGSN